MSCVICETAIPGAGPRGGRPRRTCSEECLIEWKNRRGRWSKRRRALLLALDVVTVRISHYPVLTPDQGRRLRSILRHVQTTDPAMLAREELREERLRTLTSVE